MSNELDPTEEAGVESSRDIRGTVLVVDDEPQLAGLYCSILDDQHEVSIETNGRRALEALDDDVDVVLLDRRMPGVSGDSLLQEIRNQGYGCLIAMVTSVQPDEDIIDLPFDAYLVKPVRHDDLRQLVTDLLLRSQYGEYVRESYSVASKVAALQSNLSSEELLRSERYQELLEKQAELQSENFDYMDELLENGDSGLVYRDVLEGDFEL